MNWSVKPTLGRSVLTAFVLLGLYAAGMLNRDSGGTEDEQTTVLESVVDGLDARELAVLDWRIDQLSRAGFDELRSNTLACVGDWRRAIALVKDGCDHITATDICI